jgi:hypothetical protein
MNVQPEHIVYAIGAVAGLVGLTYLVRRLGRFSLVLLGLAVAGIFGLALLEQSAATRRAAEAAEIAAVGQTASNLGLSLTLGVVLVLLVLAIGLNLWQAWKLRASRAGGKWAPGPNALWARTGSDPAAPTHSPAEAAMLLAMGQMMAGQYLALQQMLVNLLAGDETRRRRPRSWSAPRPRSLACNHILAFPADDRWEDWDEESAWSDEAYEEEGLWGVP